MIERARSGSLPDRYAWLALAAGMVVSAGLAMWFGRETWYSVDEQRWLADSADFGLATLFRDHIGHLVLVPRFVYKVIVATLGTGSYLPFRLLTLFAIFLTAALLFLFLKRRLPNFVALAPCLALLIFPADIWHYLVGNGFTIMFAIACGLAALLAFDRRDRAGDVAALLFLCLGCLTYTVALPFAVGITIACLINRDDRRRAWVGLLPLAGYALWRVLAGIATASAAQNGTDWGNLTLLPVWTFQSLAGILATLAGLNFSFDQSSTFPAGGSAGAALAVAAIVATVWRFSKGSLPRDLWTAVAIMLALFASQVIVSGADGRLPAEPRYLYPGAVLVILVGAELLRGIEWSRTAFLSVWAVTGVTLATSIGLLSKNTEWMDLWFDQAKADMTAISLLYSTGLAPPDDEQPRLRVLAEFSAAGGDAVGLRGYDASSLRDRPDWVGEQVDGFLADAENLTLVPIPPRNCRPWPAEARTGDAYELPTSGARIEVMGDGRLGLGRFSDGSVDLGPVRTGDTFQLNLLGDRDPTPWSLTGVPLRFCGGL